MTTKDSILALAAKISNGTVPNVATDAQALGELAKAMCGTAPEVPLATVDDAIAFITSNYSGGGGGVTLGDVHLVIQDYNSVQPGSDINGPSVMKISVGGAVATDMMAGAIWQNAIPTAATGATVDAIYGYINEGDEQAPTMRARTCTIDPEEYTYVTISDTIEIEHEEYVMRDAPEPAYVARFVMPEIPEGSALLLTPEYNI